MTVLVAWVAPVRFGVGMLLLSAGSGLLTGCLQPSGLLWLAGLAGCLLLYERPAQAPWIRALACAVFLALAAGLSAHLLPGFDNVRVLDKVRFSPDSAPFTLYLNFDKTVLGLLVYLLVVKPSQPFPFRAKRDGVVGEPGRPGRDALVLAAVLGSLALVILPLALLTHYVRFDPKLPPPLWLVDNLFFVCFAEEVLFRGFILTELSRFTTRAWIPLTLAASLFGLAHWAGGPPYVALASLAGVGYGYAYQKTGRIEAAILVHFGLNLLHIALFSYPRLTG